MSLVAELRVRLVDVRFEVAAGETVAILGPNGAGKSTVLRALAGLLPSGGPVSLAGERIDHLPPERRATGVVFQDYLLFPHLSALENVAFGPRCAGVARAQARAVAAEWLERVGLGEYAKAKPGQLSGGQAQRVALARALATGPRLLLMDEPLAALDARSRLEIRAQLRRHLSEFAGPSVLVTHDPLDAMTLAGRVLLLEDGRITQDGSPAEITSRPRTEYAATLAGLNLYRGDAERGVVRSGDAVLVTDSGLGGDVFVAFPPSAVALYRSRPDGSPRNVWPGRVAGVDQHGDRVRVTVEGVLPVTADVTPAALAALELAPGSEVWAAVKAAETHAYPA
ncbi:ABC transporter ATP-binding protein [Longispora albida]|uniref:ABC transporter ATP-binding protein n=1 Tax=Longispora albida TaxID=203523 RepID=UPI000374F07F|nr:ABC transporter ATP-binding protein [Longispora albida]